MAKCHVKKGDEVVVLTGTSKGRRGKIIEVLPHNQRVLVEGIKMIKKHMKKSQLHPQGAIVEREGTLHLSNVMRADKYDARLAKRGGAAPAQTPAETPAQTPAETPAETPAATPAADAASAPTQT